MVTLSPATRPPVLFSIARALERKHVRGVSRLLEFLRRTGRLQRPVDFRIDDSHGIIVPLFRLAIDRFDFENADVEFLRALGTAIRAIPGKVTLIDIGADIGVVSVKLLALCPAISGIVAFEPNDEGFQWLRMNLARLKIPAHPIAAAVADFEGAGRLVAPEARWTPGVETNYSMYFLEQAEGGPIPVTTIDSNQARFTGNIAIKIDVEGGELNVLRGAKQTVCGADHVVVALEAHPSVVARTGVDPIEFLRLLASWRPFRFTLSETGLPLSADKPVFEQTAADRIYNIIAASC